MTELVLMKLGGSVITDKTKRETAREDNIRRIAQEVKAALEKNPDLRVVIGHGGGSFPHFPAKKYGIKQGITHDQSWRGFAETRAAASKLNQLVTEIFLSEGLNVVSLQPSSSVICDNFKLDHMDIGPIQFLVEKGQVPVIYGDAVLDREKGCTIASTEDLFSYLTVQLHPSRIILVGETEGVFTSDPLSNPSAELIPEISNKNIDEVQKMLGGSHGVDVTGGMTTKINEMFGLVRIYPRMKILLVSGNTPGTVENALLDKPVRGTAIVFKGESPIPKILISDINGVIVRRGVKPWEEFLKDLVQAGLIQKEAWKQKIQPLIKQYWDKTITRDEAVRVIAPSYAAALKGQKYSDVLKVAEKTAKRIQDKHDPYVEKLLKYAKSVRKYRIVLITGNFWEVAKPIADDAGAEEVYAVGLEEKDGIVTGNLKGELMTAGGKAKAVREVIQKTGTVKERVVYLGDDASDWLAMKQCGVNVLYQPVLTKQTIADEQAWIDEVLRVIRTHEIPNLLIVTGIPENFKIENLFNM